MRLTCPNCGARYEVDEAMIPPEGRDVQCSNCTTTWFQPGLSSGLAYAAPEPPVAHREQSRPFYEEDEDDIPAVPRRELDPGVRDVLREEAAREAALRQQETGGSETTAGFETQDEMPLDAPNEYETYEDDYDEAVHDLMVEADEFGELEDAPRERAQAYADDLYQGHDLTTEQDEIEAQIATAATAGPASSASRRDLLPDIEEINSTLRATENRSARQVGATDYETIEARPRRRAGTRFGFVLALLLFGGLAALYSNAERITAAAPQAQPVMETYVSFVDRLRGWIDEIAQGALTADADGAPESATPEPVGAAPVAVEGTVVLDEPES